MVPVAEKLLRHGTFRGKNLKQNLFSEDKKCPQKKQICPQKRQICPFGYFDEISFIRSKSIVTNTTAIAISLERIERVRDWGTGSWLVSSGIVSYCNL